MSKFEKAKKQTPGEVEFSMTADGEILIEMLWCEGTTLLCKDDLPALKKLIDKAVLLAEYSGGPDLRRNDGGVGDE